MSPPLSPRALLSSAAVVGVSGSRSPARASLAAARAALTALSPSASVVTGCAAGIDAAARRLVPAARLSVLSVASGRWGCGRGAFAARSTAAVRSVAAAGSAGLWLSFPSGPCPAGLLPSASSSACFSGSGSGTWASLALALGLGVAALVGLPSGVAPPASWGLAPCGSGHGVSWFCRAGVPQLGLGL